MEKEYKIEIDARILELLGPNLYTNIYYVLAELIANAYDADAHNVYIISEEDAIRVEDDGKGMSYKEGGISKYLGVAKLSRTSEEDSFTTLGRKKMGRKGIGKLAALSVSENVDIMTVANGEKSGFVLTRHPRNGGMLIPIDDENVTFRMVHDHGTAIVMRNPEYSLHKTTDAIKRNVVNIFPLHRSAALSPLNLRRIKATREGGSWKEWPDELKLQCHKNESGRSFGSVYGRMKWDEPSPTMTTQCTGYGNGRFGHPEQDRAISAREAALLQTFPMSYRFFEDEKNVSLVKASRYIGNAVPPLLGEVVAQSILKHLSIYY